MRALTYASRSKEYVVIIHRDFTTVIDSLQHSMPSDNIYLLTIVHTVMQRILAQDGIVIN